MHERICICCGKKYEYCPHCGDYKNKPRWMTNYDDEGCHIAFQTVTDYLAGEMTKEAAKVALENVDMKNRDQFKLSVAKYVDEILGDRATEEKKNDYAVVATPEVKETKVDAVPEKKEEKKLFQQHEKHVKFEKNYNK